DLGSARESSADLPLARTKPVADRRERSLVRAGFFSGEDGGLRGSRSLRGEDLGQFGADDIESERSQRRIGDGAAKGQGTFRVRKRRNEATAAGDGSRKCTEIQSSDDGEG